MRSKPYLFCERGRWSVRWTRPLDGDTRTVLAGSFDTACTIARYLVRQYGLASA